MAAIFDATRFQSFGFYNLAKCTNYNAAYCIPDLIDGFCAAAKSRTQKSEAHFPYQFF